MLSFRQLAVRFEGRVSFPSGESPVLTGTREQLLALRSAIDTHLTAEEVSPAATTPATTGLDCAQQIGVVPTGRILKQTGSPAAVCWLKADETIALLRETKIIAVNEDLTAVYRKYIGAHEKETVDGHRQKVRDHRVYDPGSMKNKFGMLVNQDKWMDHAVKLALFAALQVKGLAGDELPQGLNLNASGENYLVSKEFGMPKRFGIYGHWTDQAYVEGQNNPEDYPAAAAVSFSNIDEISDSRFCGRSIFVDGWDYCAPDLRFDYVGVAVVFADRTQK